MRRICLRLALALAAVAALPASSWSAPYGYYRHVYAHCPYAFNYQPWGVYYAYKPFPPFYRPLVAPPWGWGYHGPLAVGMGAGVY